MSFIQTTFFLLFSFFIIVRRAHGASFNVSFPVQQFQCTNFTVNITSPEQPVFPLTLLVLPVSSSSPQFLSIPESQWNAGNNSLIFGTILPFLSGTKFAVAIHDEQGGRASAVVSELYTMQGTSDSSCGSSTTNTPSQQFFKLDPSPPNQCGIQTLTVDVPDTDNTDGNPFDNLRATGYLPGGTAFALDDAGDIKFNGDSASWSVDVPSNQTYMFLYEYQAVDGSMITETSDIQTVEKGTTSCVRAVSPSITIVANVPQQTPLGVSNTSVNNVQISGPLIVFIAVACILGSVSALVIFVVAPIVYFCRRRRKAREARLAFGMTKDIEAGKMEKSAKKQKFLPLDPMPTSIQSSKSSFFSFRRQKPPTPTLTALPTRSPKTPPRPRAITPPPVRKSSVSEKDRGVTPPLKSASLFKRAFSPTPISDTPRIDDLEMSDDSYYSRATLFLPGTVLYDKENQLPTGTKEVASINAPYASYNPPFTSTMTLATERQSPSAQSPASGRVRGKEPLPPLPPNPGAIRRPSRGRLRNENREREREREKSREREKEKAAGQKNKTASIDSFGNEGPLPLSMTETDIPPRPKLTLNTNLSPPIGVALTTGMSPSSEASIPITLSRRNVGVVGGSAVQPLRLGVKSMAPSEISTTATPTPIERPPPAAMRVRYADLERITEEAAQTAAAFAAERTNKADTPIIPRRL